MKYLKFLFSPALMGFLFVAFALVDGCGYIS